MAEVVIIMGSKGDMPWAERIKKALSGLGIDSLLRISSAHKTPEECLRIIREYDKRESVVFITVAGRSNALSGFVDAQTHHPVIACPPYNDTFSGVDIFSSLRMPSGVAPAVVLEPEAAALLAAKILGIKDPSVRQRVIQYQSMIKDKIREADREVTGG